MRAFARTPLHVALLLELVELFAQLFDTNTQHAPVQLQLGFARAAAYTDTALLPLQVGPAAHQARGKMFQLRQLHLQFTLMALGTLGKYVEDQAGSISHATFEQALQVALLGRIKIVIEDGDTRLIRLHTGGELISLARAKEIPGVRFGAAAFDRIPHLNACACYELPEFLQALLVIGPAEIEADQYCCVPASGPILHYLLLNLLVTWMIGRDGHCTSGDNGRDGMLIHHLRDCVLEQNDILIKGIHLTL